MKKVSDILLLIGGIIAFVLVPSYLIMAVLCFLSASPQAADMLTRIVQQINLPAAYPFTVEETVGFIQAYSVLCGVLLLIEMALAIVSGIVALKARSGNSQTLYVLNIVFGLICGSELNLIGAIFGLIAYKRRPKE